MAKPKLLKAESKQLKAKSMPMKAKSKPPKAKSKPPEPKVALKQSLFVDLMKHLVFKRGTPSEHRPYRVYIPNENAILELALSSRKAMDTLNVVMQQEMMAIIDTSYMYISSLDGYRSKTLKKNIAVECHNETFTRVCCRFVRNCILRHSDNANGFRQSVKFVTEMFSKMTNLTNLFTENVWTSLSLYGNDRFGGFLGDLPCYPQKLRRLTVDCHNLNRLFQNAYKFRYLKFLKVGKLSSFKALRTARGIFPLVKSIDVSLRKDEFGTPTSAEDITTIVNFLKHFPRLKKCRFTIVQCQPQFYVYYATGKHDLEGAINVDEREEEDLERIDLFMKKDPVHQYWFEKSLENSLAYCHNLRKLFEETDFGAIMELHIDDRFNGRMKFDCDLIVNAFKISGYKRRDMVDRIFLKYNLSLSRKNFVHTVSTIKEVDSKKISSKERHARNRLDVKRGDMGLD